MRPLILSMILLLAPTLPRAEPTSFVALESAAIARRDAGEPAEAVELLTDGIERWPEDPSLRLLRAQAYLRLGDTAAAREDYLAVLAQAPDHEGAREGLRLLGPASGLTLVAFGGAQSTGASGPASLALISVLSADARLFDTSGAGLTWRRIATLSSRSSNAPQQELHGRLAWEWGRLRAGLYGARLFAPEFAALPGGLAAKSTVHGAGMVGAGLTLRGPYTYAGHVLYTQHDDEVDVVQTQAGASRLFTSWLRGGLDVRLQADGSDAFPSAGLGLAAGGERTFVAVSGRFGDELRPGVVSLPHGFGHHREGTQQRVGRAHAGESINDVIDDTRVDTRSGIAAFSGTPVDVTA